MGVILGSAVVPIAICITWSRANKWGCIGGSVAGFFSGLIAWLVTTSSLNGGVINVTTSGGDYEMLAGNLASIGVGGIVAVAASLIVSEWSFLAPEPCLFQFGLQWPEDFDFELSRSLNVAHRTSTHAKGDAVGDEKVDEKISEKKGNEFTETRSVSDEEGPVIIPDPDLDPVALDKAFRFAAWSSLALVCIFSYALDHILTAPYLPDAYHAHTDSSPSLLCEHHFRRAWAHCMGRHRNYLVLLFCVYCRALPAVGESCRSYSDNAGNC